MQLLTLAKTLDRSAIPWYNLCSQQQREELDDMSRQNTWIPTAWGPIKELIVTCQTPCIGGVAITRGDALQLTGAFTANNRNDNEDVVFGQAMTDCGENGCEIPAKVRGIALFDYEGTAPTVDGMAGILAGATDGKVKAPAVGDGVGINLKVNTIDRKVHVLL